MSASMDTTTTTTDTTAIIMGRLIEDRRAVRPAPLEPESLLYVRPIPFERDEGGDVATLQKRVGRTFKANRGARARPVIMPRPHRGFVGITVKHSPGGCPTHVRASSSLAVPPTFPMNSRSPVISRPAITVRRSADGRRNDRAREESEAAGRPPPVPARREVQGRVGPAGNLRTRPPAPR